MPFWLDMLRTPMAAPETPALRGWRYGWMALCIALAACVVALQPLQRLFGQGASALAATLLLAALLVGIHYFRRKVAADREWLDRLSDGAQP